MRVRGKHLTPEERENLRNLLRGGLNPTKAARQLGMWPTTARKELKSMLADVGIGDPVERRRASMRGENGTAPVPAGFDITQIVHRKGKDGAKLGESIQMRPAPLEEFEPPIGHHIKGISALVNADGRTIQQWVKTSKASTDHSAFLEAVQDIVAGYQSPEPPVPYSEMSEVDLLTLYPIPDLHLGMYAWGKESGHDYDTTIAEQLLNDAVDRLVQQSPPSDTAVILNLGDFFHGNDSTNATPASKHALDVDTRHARVMRAGIALMRRIIQKALVKHRRVIVRNLEGNHDPQASLALSLAMEALFEKEPRVEVDDDPSPFFWLQFGNNLIFAHHGHKLKPDQAAGFMASQNPKGWGEAIYRRAFFGHLHHSAKGSGETAGAIWEILPTLARKDAWGAGKGFASESAMKAIVFHRLTGEYTRFTAPILALPSGQQTDQRRVNEINGADFKVRTL